MSLTSSAFSRQWPRSSTTSSSRSSSGCPQPTGAQLGGWRRSCSGGVSSSLPPPALPGATGWPKSSACCSSTPMLCTQVGFPDRVLGRSVRRPSHALRQYGGRGEDHQVAHRPPSDDPRRGPAAGTGAGGFRTTWSTCAEERPRQPPDATSCFSQGIRRRTRRWPDS